MLFFDITSGLVREAAVDTVPELIINVLKKLLKNVFRYFSST